MDSFLYPLAFLAFLLPSDAFFLNVTEDFSVDAKTNVAQLLVAKKFPEFETALQELFGGTEGHHLILTPSYELAMHELLLTLSQDFVVLDSVLADHVLVPQCSCQHTSAFVLEYRVLRNLKYAAPVEDKLKKVAQVALDKIDKGKYALFAAGFLHVKEVVKIGLAFYNRKSTAIVYDIEHVN